MFEEFCGTHESPRVFRDVFLQSGYRRTSCFLTSIPLYKPQSLCQSSHFFSFDYLQALVLCKQQVLPESLIVLSFASNDNNSCNGTSCRKIRASFHSSLVSLGLFEFSCFFREWFWAINTHVGRLLMSEHLRGCLSLNRQTL